MDGYDNGEVPVTPELTDSLESQRKSVSDASQALRICRRLDDDNKERVVEAARIRSKYDAISPPIPPQKLLEAGKEYKSNIPTGFMASLAGRMANRLVMRIKATQYLTSAKLPANTPNATEKSETFRRAFTEMVQSWKGFPFFLYKLAHETSLLGKSFVSTDSINDWRPRVFRIDDAAIPNGTEQGESPPFFKVKTEYTVSEAFDFIRDRETAELAGWNIDNMVEAINDAIPIRESDDEVDGSHALDYEDMVRELVPTYAFTEGANVIEVYKLFTMEYDGSINLWIVDRTNENELFHAEGVFPSMDDAVQYVCYEIGNGTVYGSNGIGQMVYELAVGVDKSRNLSFDQLRNAGKYTIQVPQGQDANSVQLHVVDDASFLIGGVFAGNTAALAANPEAYITQDRYMKGLAEERIGSFLPESQATDKSATQSQIDALKEQETRDAITDMFLTYFGMVMSMIQRRAGDLTIDDAAARKFQEECLAVMDTNEFQRLVNTPSAQTTIDFTQLRQNQISQYLLSQVGNPQWDQYGIQKTIAELNIGPDLTESLLLPPGDQTATIEATRQQQDELTGNLSQGIPVLVSPRDNHIVHMTVLSGEQDPMSGQWSGAIYAMLAEQNVQGAQAALQHFMEHYQYASQQELLGESENVVKSFIADAQDAINTAIQKLESFQAEEAAIAQGGQPV